MLERPYERKLPLNLKDSLLEGEILSEGKAICSLCNKIVPCKEVKRGGFIYLIKESHDQKLLLSGEATDKILRNPLLFSRENNKKFLCR